MIKVDNVTKSYSGRKVLDKITCNIREGSIYGIVGVNGAGKSTLLRIIAGVIKADSGLVTVDGDGMTWGNTRAKSRIAFVSDDPYFEEGATLLQSAALYKILYKKFSMSDFYLCCDRLGLDVNVSVSKMSKGQRRQSAISLALATCPEYLILDETFDGLDPIVRTKVKRLMFDKVASKNMSVIMTTHSLRELEDTCDTLALLSNGKLAVECDVEELKKSVFKLQVLSPSPITFENVEVISARERGRITEYTLRGDKEKIVSQLKECEFYDILPLTLDEVFEYEAVKTGVSV